MSFSNVVLFSNYITNSVINDKKTDFQMVDGIDMSSIIAKSTYDIPLLEFILGIFKSTIINDDHYDNIFIYVINYLNYLKTKGVYLNLLTSHRLIYILIMLANKISDDNAFDNISWANIANIDISQVNMMEYAILQIFNFDLMVVISYEKALAIYKTISTKM